jgi:radical SAM protein with 4Fe4S-binding SPASM domain
MEAVTRHPVRAQITLTPLVAHWIDDLELDPSTLRFCSRSGIPSYLKNGHKIVVLSHMECDHYFLRIGIDGYVYYSCAHLMKPGDVSHLAVGDITKESLPEIFERLSSGGSEIFERMRFLSPHCKNSKSFSYCRGGARVTGFVGNGVAINPFCHFH